jgi:hypothetical protein
LNNDFTAFVIRWVYWSVLILISNVSLPFHYWSRIISCMRSLCWEMLHLICLHAHFSIRSWIIIVSWKQIQLLCQLYLSLTHSYLLWIFYFSYLIKIKFLTAYKPFKFFNRIHFLSCFRSSPWVSNCWVIIKLSVTKVTAIL